MLAISAAAIIATAIIAAAILLVCLLVACEICCVASEIAQPADDPHAAMAGSYKEVVDALELIPHPEGGYFRETWRSGAAPMESRGKTDEGGQCMPSDRVGEQRNVMTSIYYMLTAERPHQDWVNNMSDHVHYHHAGGTLIYNLVLPDGTFVERRLGTNVAAGDEPQLVVKGGTLKSVRLEAGAEFGLLGEGVAPGFDFRDFKWVTAKELKALSPEAFAKTSDLIKPQPEETFDHFYEK